MSTKYVRDTSAGKALSAWVIIKAGKAVATVQASFGSGGGVLVNVWNHGDAAQARTAKVLRAADPKLTGSDYNVAGFQTGRAGGYGYDKLTAALRGLVIDGIPMTDHCSRLGAPKVPKGRKTYPTDYKPPAGYSLANYADGSKRDYDGAKRYHSIPDDEAGYTDCYRDSGLKVLSSKGYKVIQAL